MHKESAYLVFLAIGSHGQRSVGDSVCLVLEWLKNHGGRGAPLLALDDRADGALLVGGVRHVQGLGQKATYWANKIHHLWTHG